MTGAEALDWTAELEAELMALEGYELEAEGFDPYIRRMTPRLPPPRHIHPLVDLWERTRKGPVYAVVEMPPRHAKRIADSCPVFTPDGWTTHGDLRPGCRVYAPDGTPTEVVHRSPGGVCDLLITFSDGEQIVTHADHLWGVQDRRSHTWKTVDTATMMADLHYGTSRGGKPRARWILPYTEPLAGSHEAVPFEPYFLGMWLGDGAADCARIGGSVDDNRHRMAELEARGHRIGAQHVQEATGVHYFAVLSDKPKGQGVIGYFGGDKRIPAEYMTADLAIRRDLVAGLVDSDGHVEQHTGRVRFVNTNRALIDGCAELVRGLGYRATVSESAVGTKGKLPCWTVQWTPHDGRAQGYLPRRAIERRGIRRMRSVVNIEPCTPEEGHCIQVAHESHLYLVGESLTPTHNTTTAVNGFGWRMMLDPSLHNAYITYADSLSLIKSRAVRNLVKASGMGPSPIQTTEISSPVELATENVHHWETKEGGSFLATGVGGGITGKGITGVAVIDDPHKNREEAESRLIRDKIWDWFTDTFWTRLEDSASVIVIQTRWHRDDLVGRILKGFEDPETGEKIQFERIRLPAIAEEDDMLGRAYGEALWPERFPLKKLYGIRSIQGPYGFASLYQQRPIAKGAQLFGDHPSRFLLKDWKLDGHRVIIACDPAASIETSADHSAILVLAAKGYADLMEAWIIGHYREQVLIPDLVRVLLGFQKRFWGVAIGVEAVAGFKAVPQSLRDQEPKLKVLDVIPVGDKWTRAQAIASAWNEGRVHVPTDVPWAESLMAEFTDFTPGAKVDDRIDCGSHGWNTLYQEGPPRPRTSRRDRQRPFG